MAKDKHYRKSSHFHAARQSRSPSPVILPIDMKKVKGNFEHEDIHKDKDRSAKGIIKSKGD